MGHSPPRYVDLSPPAAEKRPVVLHAHGVEWQDDYAWLKAANWREVLRRPEALPAEIRAHLDAENGYSDAVLAPCVALQQTIARELRARLKEDDSEAPQPDGPFAYYMRFREGGQHKIYCRTPREGGAETVILDGDELAHGKAFFQLLDARHSPDHRRVAWSADEMGSELHAVLVREIGETKDFPDIVENCTGQVVWTTGSEAFLYVRIDEDHRPCAVLLHRLGTPPAEDVVVYEEPDPGWFVSIARTRSGRFCVVSVHGHDASECHLVELAAPLAPPRLVAPRESGVRTEALHHGDELYLRTSADGAADFKIVAARLADPRREYWRIVTPHRPGVLIVAAAVFRDFLARLEREDGLPRIVIRALDSGEEHVVAFDQEAYFLGFENVFEFESRIIRFSFSSMTTPKETYDYEMVSRTRKLVKKQEVPSGFDPNAYVSQRIFANADDGETVPISVLHRRDVKLDGTAPLLIYGYGAYGHAMDASFSSNRLSLVDRGFVYAIAHVRGGTDKGWRWYEEGKLARKGATFSDFIAATRRLIVAGYGAPDRAVAHGGSAGGMLMGAIANMAPDLFAGIIADVPFVDVLNTMLDPELPLTPPEWLEWGNPILDPGAFATIRGYSPYDNVRAQAYPAILALAGLTDPRVTYWESAKWIARLRATMTGGGPVLLRTNMEAGHGGASGRFDQLEDIALAYAFAVTCAAGAFGEPG
jgi:oligopeptidase B